MALREKSFSPGSNHTLPLSLKKEGPVFSTSILCTHVNYPPYIDKSKIYTKHNISCSSDSFYVQSVYVYGAFVLNIPHSGCTLDRKSNFLIGDVNISENKSKRNIQNGNFSFCIAFDHRLTFVHNKPSSCSRLSSC